MSNYTLPTERDSPSVGWDFLGEKVRILGLGRFEMTGEMLRRRVDG
ncbi:MAG: hypothetical protein ACFCBU_09240 [Cyanophyceae cyanobacterium]